MRYSAAPGPTGWGWLAMTVIVALFVALSVAAGGRLFRGGDRRSGRAAGPEDSPAERLLADRFARGEIDGQEYRHLAAALEAARLSRDRDSRPPPGPRRRA